jgi:hypothetical protein
MGGVRINKALYVQCEDALGLHLAWDEGSRKATFTAVKLLPNKVTKEDLFEVMLAKKSSQATIPGLAPFLRMKDYDFKASGNQNMALACAETKAGYQFSFTLPKGHLTPAPKQVRKPRAVKPKVAPQVAAQVDQSLADLV